MGNFEGDEQLADFLKTRHEQGDESYFVEAAIIESLSKILDAPPRETLEACLSKDSHRDVIRVNALKGLSRSPAPEALETLKTWTKRGHSRTARMAAMEALAQSLKKHEFPKDKQTGALDLLASYLKEPGPRIRRSSIAALTQVPHLAQNEKDRLETMSEHDGDPRVRTAAKAALKKLDEAKPPVQMQKLQSELNKLQEQYKKLQEQIEKIQTQTKGK